MPRYPGGDYYLPPGTIAAPDTTIESTKYNVFTADVETELNAQIDKDAAQDAALAAIGSSTVAFTPTGDIVATNVQAAIVEVDAEMHAADTTLQANIDTKVAKAGDTMSGHLTLPTGPAAANAVRKDYVDAADAALSTADALKVLKAGDTMTGHLTLPTGPAAANAVRKDYVDAADTTLTTNANSRVLRAGDTMTGALTVQGDITAYRAGGTTGVIYLANSGARYLYWDGSNYQFGSSGTAWHSGNFTPSSYVSNGRLPYAGDYTFGGGLPEPWNGSVMSSYDFTGPTGRFRYVQGYTSGWFTFAYA